MSALRSVSNLLLRVPTGPSAVRTTAVAHRHSVEPASIAAYHSSSVARFPYKDDQDRNSLKPKSTEGTKSGTDDAAADTDAAFDPSKTSPEEEKSAASAEKGGSDPLEVSGANHAKSKPPGGKGGAEMKDTTKQESSKASRGGSPEKKGKPPVA